MRKWDRLLHAQPDGEDEEQRGAGDEVAVLDEDFAPGEVGLRIEGGADVGRCGSGAEEQFAEGADVGRSFVGVHGERLEDGAFRRVA